ncbi:hypothetical protein [Sporomusa silvacetica]|uniref:hypothetical protein n=1 Tax=Sporomusa silvacetica TaxID=55504 RepID=UPI001FEB9D32|nr:hypothetical protein [Sporomusa silvacetica]
MAGETRQAAGIKSFLASTDAGSNPALISRNHRVEAALEAAVKQGDCSLMDRLLAVLSNPFARTPEPADYSTLHEPSARPYRTFCGT